MTSDVWDVVTMRRGRWGLRLVARCASQYRKERRVSRMRCAAPEHDLLPTTAVLIRDKPPPKSEAAPFHRAYEAAAKIDLTSLRRLGM